jgi:mannose/fructose/N-acetylgalactosamine-specific phosphotransferase system component IIC
MEDNLKYEIPIGLALVLGFTVSVFWTLALTGVAAIGALLYLKFVNPNA